MLCKGRKIKDQRGFEELEVDVWKWEGTGADSVVCVSFARGFGGEKD
jgi:hypothetical protein